MATAVRSLALVTNAASGIGFELAKCCAENGFDLVVAAEEPEIQLAAQTFRDHGAMVLAVQTDLTSPEGIERLGAELDGLGHPVEMLLIDAGRGPGGPFLDRDLNLARHALQANLLGTLSLVHRVGGRMRERGRGRILIVGAAPGEAEPVQTGIKFFLENFTHAVRADFKESGVIVTCAVPDSSGIGEPAEIARQSYAAMMGDEGEHDWKDRLRAVLSQVTGNEASPHSSH